MSVFTEYAETYSYYGNTDSNSTKIATKDAVATLTVDTVVIHLGVIDRAVVGDVFGDYRANVNSTAGAQMSKGGYLSNGTDTYQIIDNPEPRKLFDDYLINLKKV